MTKLTVRQAQVEDAKAIAEIYNYYVRNTVVTFEEEPVSAEAMATRIVDVQAASLPWLVAEVAHAVVGYACASRWKTRSAYRNSVETTIYLEHGHDRKGIGTRLYEALLVQLSALRHHAVIGGMALPNEASIALHSKLGFEYVGTFREVGYKQGRWVDVAYWQKML